MSFGITYQDPLTKFNLSEIKSAGNRISPYIFRTPVRKYHSIDQLIGANVWVKHENFQPTGSFKLRGALNVIALLSDAQREKGVIAASSGNFGQGVAYAVQKIGGQSFVVVPEGANPDKVMAIQEMGAKIITFGGNFDEAREEAERLSLDRGYFYIHSANNYELITGVATYGLEIINDLTDVEVVIVPVGGGSGVCGVGIAAYLLNPNIKVIAVQSENAPAAHLSWKKGEIIESKMETIAEGLATREGYELTQKIMSEVVHDFMLVSESELKEAIILYLKMTHTLAEHASAAALAAAIKIKEKLKDKKVVMIHSGSNITVPQLIDAINS
ncbi:MAG: threonine ammonia-lyase [Chloroflexi bacterium]|nr:threonine ammonia-lyase [Chloroflexota bacterium]MQG05505.1 pyridoxal-phosphate dependent enzyme [SAR202 cluster bacterium]|tara:strand:- start:4801 stop:5787 length:987 start_codon:yes stop_codon:yes gene_type:complete